MSENAVIEHGSPSVMDRGGNSCWVIKSYLIVLSW